MCCPSGPPTMRLAEESRWWRSGRRFAGTTKLSSPPRKYHAAAGTAMPAGTEQVCRYASDQSDVPGWRRYMSRSAMKNLGEHSLSQYRTRRTWEQHCPPECRTAHSEYAGMRRVRRIAVEVTLRHERPPGTPHALAQYWTGRRSRIGE
eukprot:3250804-Rhodomonas_salina.1